MIHGRILATLLSLFVALSAIPFVSMADGGAPGITGEGGGGSTPAVPGGPGGTPTPSPTPLPPKQILDSRHYSSTLKDGSIFTFTANLLKVNGANAKTSGAVFDYNYGICKSDGAASWCAGTSSTEVSGKISGSTWKISVYFPVAFSATLDKEYGMIWMQGYGWIAVRAIKSDEKISTPTPTPKPSPKTPITT